MRRHARIPAGLLDDVPPGPVKVLLAIAGHVNTYTSSAHITLERLSNETSYSRRQIQYHLRHLEDLGLLVTTPGNGRGRLSEYHCPWHLYTVRRPAMSTPVDNPGRVQSTAPFNAGKGAGSRTERVQPIAPPISTTDKNNNTPRADSRACTHGVRFGDRFDEHGISTGGCYRCEREQATG